MRFLTCLAVAFLSLSGCKKQIEQKKEDLLLQFIVAGQWSVTKYTKSSNDITFLFSSYRFQFKKDYSVDALNNGTVENTGTWTGNVDTETITSNFPNSNTTLALLDGTWKITNSDVTFVEATQTINGDSCFLRLVKN